MTSNTIKALTVPQPWALLIAAGAKRIETHGWRTSHRGSLAIHAGLRMPEAALLAQEPFHTALSTVLACGPLPRGAIIAIARLVDVVPITPELEDQISADERAFGDYGPNRWAWQLADAQPFDRPISARGVLHLWKWEPPPGVLESPGLLKR
jgi:hypothetical protein